MLWKTHIRLAYEILRRLGVPKSSPEAADLREGIITPDKWEDFPHHHSKEQDIEEHIMKARGFFLNDNMGRACFHLGVALHYVQDSYVSLTTRSEHHTRWEEQMDEAYFTEDLQRLVEKAFYNSPDRKEEYLERVDLLSENLEGKVATLHLATKSGPGFSYWGYREWGKPHVDVNLALRASILISESVFSPKTYPKLQEQLKSVHQQYERKLREVEVSSAKIIAESIKRRDEMEGRKQKNGLFQRIKNGYWTINIRRYGFQIKRKLEIYKKKKHLKRVLGEYKRITDKLVVPHRNWYHYSIPGIQLNIVDRELLLVGDVSDCVGAKESVVMDLIARNKISCYKVGDEEFVLRSELAKHLSE